MNERYRYVLNTSTACNNLLLLMFYADRKLRDNIKNLNIQIIHPHSTRLKEIDLFNIHEYIHNYMSIINIVCRVNDR